MTEQEHMDTSDLALIRAMKVLASSLNQPAENLTMALRALEVDLVSRVIVDEDTMEG